MKLGVLDYGLVDYGKTDRDALGESVKLAQKAEELGFSRFWVAEHHNITAFSTSSPELWMSYLASKTKSIRIGSGGIMALHYSSYKIAELINNLELMYPNRIDLGIGNSQGTTLVHRAMKSIHQKADYDEILESLKNYLYESDDVKLPVRPKMDTKPEIFVLSNSESTAKKAGELGIGYTFGVFPYMNKNLIESAKIVSEVYKKSFKPSKYLSKPYLVFAAFIIIADTNEEAENLAKCLDVWMLGKNDFNEFDTYPTAKIAENYPLTDREKGIISANRKRFIVGDPKKVKKELDNLCDISGAQEVLAIPLMPDIKNRCRALELLAKLYL